MRYKLLICLLGLALFVLQGCSGAAETQIPLVKIIVATPEGVIIKSENPLYINSGDSAEFMLQISDGFKLVSIDTVESAVSSLSGATNVSGIIYENGLLRLDSAFYPATIRLNVRPFEYYNYIIENDASRGTISSAAQTGSIREDTPVTISAEASGDYIFIGWSSGALLADGGILLSYSPEYSFTLVSDMTIFPNYISIHNQYIKYNANGGVIAGSNAEIFYYEVRTHHYPCPNVFGDTGIFEREGYALLEYNTKPDGSGTAINLGGNVVMGGENIVELFAQWVKYTDASMFVYSESDGLININYYHGDDEFVVIPEEISGKPVVSIGESALAGKSFKKLFLTKNLTTVSPAAIVDCMNLETLYLSDSITAISNASISNCPNLANLRINAVQPPRYAQALAWGSPIKYKRLITAPGKRLILISGSSSAFGLYSPLLSELLSDEYEIVNFGTHAVAPALFFLEFTANQIREHELIILAPEPFTQQQGSNIFEPILWQLIEGYYDSFRYVDIRNYENVYTSFAEYNTARRNLAPLDYDDYIPDVNIYGDMIAHRPDKPKDFAANWNSIAFNISYINIENAARLNRINDMISTRGARMYWSFAPANQNALNAQSRTESVYDAYNDNIRNLLNFPVISKIQDYIMAGNLFYDTEHHPSTDGALMRTRKLAEDILTQFALEMRE